MRAAPWAPNSSRPQISEHRLLPLQSEDLRWSPSLSSRTYASIPRPEESFVRANHGFPEWFVRREPFRPSLGESRLLDSREAVAPPHSETARSYPRLNYSRHSEALKIAPKQSAGKTLFPYPARRASLRVR